MGLDGRDQRAAGYEGPIRYGFGTEPPVMLVRAVDLGLEALRERHQRQEFQENV